MPVTGAALGPTISAIGQAQSWADKALQSANEALGALAGTDYPYTEITWGVGMGASKATEPTLPDLPAAPGTFSMPEKPGLADTRIIPAPTKPTYVVPDLPALKDITLPEKPSTSIPVMDSVTLGSMISLLIPNTPDISIPDLSVTPPTPISITPGSYNFSVDNILIADDPMVQAMITRLTNNIRNGGTGLTPEIEADIWDRDLERMEQQLEDSTDKVVSMWAKKGFSLPDGMLANSLSDLQKEYMNKRIDRSREIAIKQAELEQNNIFKSIELAVSLAFKLIDALENYQKLVIDAQEMTAKYANEYITLQIATHNSNIELFRARVQMHEIAVRSAMTEVEIYKAQLEGELAKVNINESTVKLYSTQVEVALAKYRGTLEGNKISAEIFTAEVQGALAEAQVQESLIKIYGEKIKALMAVVDIYKAEVEAMVAEISGEKAKIEGNVALIEMWGKEVDANAKQKQIELEVYKVGGDMSIAVANLANNINDTNVKLKIANGQLNHQNLALQQAAIQAAGNAKVEIAKAVASVSASMAAGAMAAVNASTSISYGESKSDSYSESISI
jgi:hypothetical protein